MAGLEIGVFAFILEAEKVAEGWWQGASLAAAIFPPIARSWVFQQIS